MEKGAHAGQHAPNSHHTLPPFPFILRHFLPYSASGIYNEAIKRTNEKRSKNLFPLESMKL